VVRKTPQSKPWVVHVDKLKAFRGEIPKQWRDIEKGRPAVSDDVVEPQRQNAEDVENQAIAGRNSPTVSRNDAGRNNPTVRGKDVGRNNFGGKDAGRNNLSGKNAGKNNFGGKTAGRNSPTVGGNNPAAGCDRPKRTVYVPRYLSDYKTDVVSKLMSNMADAEDLGVGLLVCDLLKGTEACGMAFETESGIRKHMLREHNAKYRRSGRHELLSGDVLKCELAKLKYGQANSRTRRRRKAAVSHTEVSADGGAMEEETTMSAGMQPTVAAEDLILDDEQWQGLVYMLAGETSVVNSLFTDIGQPSLEPVISTVGTQTETGETEDVAQGYNGALTFGPPLTLSGVVSVIGAQATTAPGDLARRLTHFAGFGRSLSGREHELLEFAGRVVAIRERQIAADIADRFQQASTSSNPPAVGRLLFTELYERLSRRPMNPGSPYRQHMDE